MSKQDMTRKNAKNKFLGWFKRIHDRLALLPKPIPDRFLASVAMIWAFWGVHGVLRIFVLSRHNAFGLPFVSKFDWYIFHALAIDFLWLFPLAIPLFVLGFIARHTQKKRWFDFVFYGYFWLNMLLVILALIDHEVMRFMGMHLTPSLLKTYGNESAIREVLVMIMQDQSVPGLPLVLLGGIIPLTLLFYALIRKWVRTPIRSLVVILLMGSLFWLYKDVLWKGGHRERKLAPVIQTFAKDFRGKPLEASLDFQKQVTDEYRSLWYKLEGDSSWVFPVDSLPFYREPLEVFCSKRKNSGYADPNGDPDHFQWGRCQEDRDGDGFSPADGDCKDNDPAVFPGAEDVPTDFVDQDCSGADSAPVNFALFFLESHRAVHAGFLKNYGAWADATPFLNKEATKGHFWTRFDAGGLPTIGALMAAHLSLPAHQQKYIAASYTNLIQKSFVNSLREKGYFSHLFSAADPAWDNQIPWLGQWYDGYTYDRSREYDADMLAHMGQWMQDSLPSRQPWIVSAITKTNHYPFNQVPGIDDASDPDNLELRMVESMKYTERSLEKLVNGLRANPDFDNTVFLFLADHGFSLGLRPQEHSSAKIGNGLYTESTWVPFIMTGKPLEQIYTERVHEKAANQMDIGPTLLDLAGIRVPNSFWGHSLFRDSVRSFSLLVHFAEAMVEADSLRFHCSLREEPRDNGPQVFNILHDRNEMTDLYQSFQEEHKEACEQIRRFSLLNSVAIQDNRIFPKF